MSVNVVTSAPDARAATVGSLQALAALWRATDLARAGRYGDAERELAAHATGSHRVAALDLLARIRAQQDRLGDAESLWREAAQIDPQDRRVQKALERVVKARRLPPRLVRRGLLLAGVVVLAGAAILVTRNVRLRATPETSVATAPEAARPSPTPLQTTTPTPPPASAAEVQPPDVTISVPGAVVAARGPELAVAFRSGLFERGTRLTDDARNGLAALGRQLSQAPGPISVTIVGFTDDVPVPPESRYTDNAHLGMARAAAVYSQLRSSSGLDASAFSLRTAGERGDWITPRPDGRDRRNVELRISRGRS
jgi:flagellar motor protein MotB